MTMVRAEQNRRRNIIKCSRRRSRAWEKLKLPPGTVADRERQSQNQLILSFYPTMPQRSETLTFPHR